MRHNAYHDVTDVETMRDLIANNPTTPISPNDMILALSKLPDASE